MVQFPNRKVVSDLGRQILDEFYEKVEQGDVEGFLMISKHADGQWTHCRDFETTPTIMYEILGILDLTKDEVRHSIYNYMEEDEDADG